MLGTGFGTTAVFEVLAAQSVNRQPEVDYNIPNTYIV